MTGSLTIAGSLTPARPLLVASGLSKIYRVRPPRDRRRDEAPPAVVAVRRADLVLGAGELVVLQGPSGSGKTTLLNLIVGFEAPDEGSVEWPSEPAAAGPPSWEHLAVVPQALGLLDELTLAENVGLPLRLRARRLDDEARSVVAGWLDRLGLEHVADHRPGEASLGEQQRAAVGRALVVGPHVVVLDEPTAHQDAASRDRVVAALVEAAAGGAAVLVATHDPAVGVAAHRVVHMEDGVLTEGRP